MKEMMKMTGYKPSRKEVLAHFGFGTERMKNFKICPHCGNAQKAENIFCGACHARLAADTLFDIYKAKHQCCARCGNVLPKDAEFCPACGEKQNQEREAI